MHRLKGDVYYPSQILVLSYVICRLDTGHQYATVKLHFRVQGPGQTERTTALIHDLHHISQYLKVNIVTIGSDHSNTQPQMAFRGQTIGPVLNMPYQEWPTQHFTVDDGEFGSVQQPSKDHRTAVDCGVV